MEQTKIREIISQMTLEEKAGMCSGEDFWHLKGIERLGIPSVMVTDGPHGIRKQDEAADHLGINDSVAAVCFPAGCAAASSFDRDLIKKMGRTIGEECQRLNISTILGPAVNIKRSPLCGRNFEYYSEDPVVASEMGAAMVEGVQSAGVGTSVKHFFANNQEKRRMTVSSNVSDRAQREIYLAAFENIIKNAKPWTVMSSYNRVNGTYVGDNKKYLTDILRNEWGFDGYVMSDWGGVNERVTALAAGLDLEMPGNGGINDALIKKAVQNGELSEDVLDTAVERILNIIFRYAEGHAAYEEGELDFEADHAIAAEVEEGCIVLLKNEDDILPLSERSRIAFIGKYAEKPRYQGGGSSHINSYKVEGALEAVSGIAEVTFAQGYDDAEDAINSELELEAAAVASAADAAVIFAGLPDSFESEGYDRKHLNLPENQNHLIETVLKTQKNVIVVLHNGSPVIMPWKDKVKGIAEAYLGGQAVGKAVVNVLFGKVNPSGRLAETFPEKLEDTPCYLTYGKGKDEADYNEDIFVGYRYYSTRNMKVQFPFGYGLSYTTFAYSDLSVTVDEADDRDSEEQVKQQKESYTDCDTIKVSVKVKNTGNRPGKEVVQLYVSKKDSEIVRPVRELKGFEKIDLAAGEEKTVEFTLDARAFSSWNEDAADWRMENGAYEICIGKNAQEMVLSHVVEMQETRPVPKVYSLNSCMGELFTDPKAAAVMAPFMQGLAGNEEAEKLDQQQKAQEEKEDAALSSEMMAAMMQEMTLRQLISFVPGIDREQVLGLIQLLNA